MAQQNMYQFFIFQKKREDLQNYVNRIYNGWHKTIETNALPCLAGSLTPVFKKNCHKP